MAAQNSGLWRIQRKQMLHLTETVVELEKALLKICVSKMFCRIKAIELNDESLHKLILKICTQDSRLQLESWNSVMTGT